MEGAQLAGEAMKRSRAIYSIAAACALSGCAAAPYTLTEAFSAADFAPYAGAGPATLSGQAFLTTQTDEVKTCAGNKVLLVPSTAYDEEAISHSDGLALDSLSPGAKAFIRTGICDAGGNFSFAFIPTGRWYVLTQVAWVAPVNQYVGLNQGGRMVEEVTVGSGQNRVILAGDALNRKV
jgi:hypothetical protein